MNISDFIAQQHSQWALYQKNIEQLQSIQQREIEVGDFSFRLQFNPMRIQSSQAKIDAASITARPCFLCDKNRPSEQQHLSYGKEEGAINDYKILCNPFPIFPNHLTIVSTIHTDQIFTASRLVDMLQMCSGILSDYVLFFNGANSGASAPDHLHFQAIPKGVLPLQAQSERYEIVEIEKTQLRRINNFPGRPYIETQQDPQIMIARMVDMNAELRGIQKNNFPDMNILVWKDMDTFYLVVFHRSKHRPECYFAEPPAQRIISPGAIDMGGTLICTRKEDFDAITPEQVLSIFEEICFTTDPEH